jgi:hypothetical protein
MKKLVAFLMLIFAFSGNVYAKGEDGGMGCFETPANDAVFNDVTGFNKQAQREKAYGSLENPAQELMFCAAAVATQPLAKQNCRCVKRVKDLCGFGFKKKRIFYQFSGGAQKAWCMAFPLKMWTRL